ncbi:MAG: hypothetical protein JST15_08955 [Bacteroidetes bacterium]|nr:hypothetical protein [Bacteroidota bacterium]
MNLTFFLKCCLKIPDAVYVSNSEINTEIRTGLDRNHNVSVSSFTISPFAAEADVYEMKISFQSDCNSAH